MNILRSQSQLMLRLQNQGRKSIGALIGFAAVGLALVSCTAGTNRYPNPKFIQALSIVESKTTFPLTDLTLTKLMEELAGQNFSVEREYVGGNYKKNEWQRELAPNPNDYEHIDIKTCNGSDRIKSFSLTVYAIDAQTIERETKFVTANPSLFELSVSQNSTPGGDQFDRKKYILKSDARQRATAEGLYNGTQQIEATAGSVKHLTIGVSDGLDHSLGRRKVKVVMDASFSCE